MRTICTRAILTALIALAGAASAQAWYGPWAGPWGGGYYYVLGSQRPPHFAMYPPVYYSRSVSYPYGRSPLPNYPSAQNPPNEVVRTIKAPRTTTTTAAAEAKPAPKPLKINNPHYKKSS